MLTALASLLFVTGALLLGAGPAMAAAPKVIIAEEHGATW